ncbi:hypothetical protein T08_11678, partial [Trichinella sp. T8]
LNNFLEVLLQGFFQCFEICFTFVFHFRTINGKACCAVNM